MLASRAAAGADGKIPAYVEIGACNATPADEVMSILRVELGARLVDTPREAGCHVTVECYGNIVLVSVAAPGRPKRSHRTNLSGSPPNVRPRIVAIQIAEVVRDIAREPEPPPGPEGPPKVTLPSFVPAPLGPERPTETGPREPPGPVALAAFAVASTFRLDGRWLLGGGLRLDYSHGWVSAGVDATLATRQDALDLGTAEMLVTRLSPHVAWRLASSAVALRLGAGYALGWAKITGQPAGSAAVGGTVTGAWTGPYALAGVAWAMAGDLSLDLRAEAGWVMVPVIGEVARGSDVAVQGAWTSVLAGFSLAL